MSYRSHLRIWFYYKTGRNHPLSSNIFKNQITTLAISIDNNKETVLTVVNIYNYIFTTFTSLMHLKLYESSYSLSEIRLIFDGSQSNSVMSSLSIYFLFNSIRKCVNSSRNSSHLSVNFFFFQELRFHLQNKSVQLAFLYFYLI